MSDKKRNNLPIVEEFLKYLLDERHFSPYTSRCYGVDLRQYVEFITDELKINSTLDQEKDALRVRLNVPNEGANDVIGKLGPATITSAMIDADGNLIRAFLSRLDEHQYSSATVARSVIRI